MRNLFWKFILATLCLALLFTVGISAAEREVYVCSGSSGNGTLQSPVGTLTDAVNLLNGKGGTVILLLTLGVAENISVLSTMLQHPCIGIGFQHGAVVKDCILAVEQGVGGHIKSKAGLVLTAAGAKENLCSVSCIAGVIYL